MNATRHLPSAGLRAQSAGLRALLLVLLLPASAACASKWEVRSTPAPLELQWPGQPGRAKVTYAESISGFGRQKDSSTVFKAVVYGGGGGEQGAFVLPVAVAKGADGRLAVADRGLACVHLYLPGEKRYVRLTGGEGGRIVSPVAVAFDDASRLFVSDSAGAVFGFDPAGRLLLTIRKAGSEPLQRPTGLAWSTRRKLLYVVDTLANRVHAYDSRGEFAFSFGRRGEEASLFNFPTHIFLAPSGEIYVTNSLAFRIEIFDEDGAPLGSFGRHGDGWGDLAMPKGIAVDRDGVIYVVDSLFDNVQLFDRDGRFLLTVGGRGSEPGEFWLPSGAFIGPDDELYVCDTYNRRIQVFRIAEGYAEHAL